jgi:hypothetical protein
MSVSTACESHEWVVYSTDSRYDLMGPGRSRYSWQHTCLLMVQCATCGMSGAVWAPTAAEWLAAFDASRRPYRWADASRVSQEGVAIQLIVRRQPGKVCECLASGRVDDSGEYERLPDPRERPPNDFYQSDPPLTDQEKWNLAALANAVVENGLCSRRFSSFVRHCGQHAETQIPVAARVVAGRIEHWHSKGLHMSPGIVAFMLRSTIAASNGSIAAICR